MLSGCAWAVCPQGIARATPAPGGGAVIVCIVPPNELPHTFKLLTIWLVVTVVLFLGFQAWERHREASRFQLAGRTIVLARSADGHFHWPGRVNGIEVDFLVDTGATSTALPRTATGMRQSRKRRAAR